MIVIGSTTESDTPNSHFCQTKPIPPRLVSRPSKNKPNIAHRRNALFQKVDVEEARSRHRSPGTLQRYGWRFGFSLQCVGHDMFPMLHSAVVLWY